MTNQPPQDDLLLLVTDTARMIGTYADRVARRQGMTKAQWVLLLKLSRHPGLSQKDLAELMEVEPITVGRLVDRLEARGLVTREADEQDRRIWRLRLAPAAEPLLQILAGYRADLAAMLVSGITQETIQTMEMGLGQVKANVIAALKGTEAPDGHQDSKVAAAR